MELTFNRIDLAKSPSPPGDIISRGHGEQWWVPFNAFTPGSAVDWKMYKREDQVFIPLIPYLSEPSVELSLAFMLQLGASLALSVPVKASRLHITTGTPVNSVQMDGVDYWQTHVGFGFLAEK